MFPNIERVEVHGADSETLYSSISSGVVKCKPIGIRAYEKVISSSTGNGARVDTEALDPSISSGAVERKSIDICIDDRSLVFYADTGVPIVLKSISEGRLANEEHTLALKEMFPDVAFFRDVALYKEGMSDIEADHVLGIIDASPNETGQTEYDIQKLFGFIKAQYDRRGCQVVCIDGDKRFDSLTFEDLLANELIEVDKHGSVSLIKWLGSVAPIGNRPVLWSAARSALDVLPVLDVTVPESRGSLQQYIRTLPMLEQATLKILYANGQPFVTYGKNVPPYASLSQEFFDALFDYSGSEIVVSEDIKDYCELKSIPARINGSVTFCGNRSEEEKRKMLDKFANTRKSGNIKTISIQGVSSPCKVRKDVFYYSNVNIAFPDLVESEDEAETAIKQYELFENEQTIFDKNLGIVVLHNSRPKKTFRYLFKKRGEFRILQLNGVFDDVYTAPNKRLVINYGIREINFEPKANAGLTFVLPYKLSYVNEGFWQAGNSYILNARSEQGALNYLKSIKERHDIDISDRPDGFGFWHISKKMPAKINEKSFKVNRILVLQMDN